MVRAKGKANASTKRSVSKADAAVASEADTTLDSSEVENHIETGGSVEISVETAVNSTVVTEETMITLVEEEEENDGAETETLEGEHAMEEDEDNKENEVSGGGDEKCVSDKEEEDAISNDEGNNQENTIEQEDGEQIIDDQQVGDAAGVDKDNQEDEMPKQEDETNANEENKEKIEGEKNKEKIEGSLKQKAKKMKRRNNRKRKTNGSPQEKGENKQVMKKVASNGKVGKDLGKLESNDGEQSSKKVASGGKPRVVAQGKDEPESSHKKLSSKKKAKGMGMIFMCNSETKKDCYRYKVLGLPASKKEMVEKIYKGMRLFLYDVDLKLMYGIYKAAERGGYNIAPKAFKSQFPSQVRFSVLDDCLPLAEETFRQAIKKNYFTRSKFDCLLSSEQVKDLCKLFTAASKGSRSKDTRLGFETSAKSKRDRVKRRGRDGRRQAERARRPERVEERGYRQRVEERGYRQRVEEHGYREQVEERVYHERPQFHERDLVTSPLVPLAALQPLPPPAPVQSYAYSRTSRTDPYRRDTVIQHDDTYRQSRLVELPDAYRRDTVPCNPDVYRRQAVVEPRDTVLGNPDVYRRRAVVEPRDTVLGNPDVYRRQAVVEPRDYYRQDGFPERREYHQPLSLETRLRDDIGINDPYVSYRERVSFRDPVNSARSEPEYDPPPVGLRSVYRHGGISTEYSTRSVLPEYPSSAASSLYEYPRQPQFRY